LFSDDNRKNINMNILILGCGFTGQRVARRFLERGVRTIVTTRDPARLGELRAAGAEVILLEKVPEFIQTASDLRVLHSIPPGPDVRPLLVGVPTRLVYLSSTAVYGSATEVNASTPVDDAGERAHGRIVAEGEMREGPWSTLVLRPAAIYGPGRGVQESFPRGEYSAGDNFVSRIHVDDLAAHVEAGLLSDITGTFPVADEEPCTSRQIAEFCADLLGLPMPDASSTFVPSAARVTGNRRVDGSEIRRLLGVTLQFPSYRTGIPASLGRTEGSL
jgi:nucleoside-diphosphate-sugar epimerase